MSAEKVEISLDASVLLRVLGVLVVLLLIASIAGQVATLAFGHDHVKGFVPLFNVDAERNVPTFFSVLLLITAAFLLAVTASIEARKTRPYWQWALLSSGFLLMGFDEAFSFHERLIDPMKQVLGGGDLGVFSYAWVVPGLVLVLLLLLVFFRFVMQLPTPTRRRFIVAGALYIGGAIGMEMIGGWVREVHGFYSWQYSTSVTIEEGMEMAGLITFISALLWRWADNGTAILVRFREA